MADLGLGDGDDESDGQDEAERRYELSALTEVGCM